MTDQQIREILKRMSEQDKKIDEIFEQNKRQFQMLEPMHKIFVSAQGFSGVTGSILKGLILLGAGIGVIYGLIKYLKA
jgi:predicted nucleotidyltransferase